MIRANGKVIEFEKFPNGETRVKKIESKEFNNITFKYEDDSDLIKLMFVRKMLNGPCQLNILYMPYSRMDRKNDEFAFTLKDVCKFIKDLKFDLIEVIEPHSDVCARLLKASRNFITPSLLSLNLDDIKPDYILFPDQGARERYESMFLYFGKPIIHANKVRDFKTGRIESLEIAGEIEQGANVVIVDDLCSYGGTFILAAEKLKELGAGDITLIVGHAEESILKGKIPDSDLIQKVFTTNTIIDKSLETDKIKIMDVF
jgi:ribose-phosphate pyrophosphokinase